MGPSQIIAHKVMLSERGRETRAGQPTPLGHFISMAGGAVGAQLHSRLKYVCEGLRLDLGRLLPVLIEDALDEIGVAARRVGGVIR